MMKATFPTLILLVILAVGCGVKGPLTPPDVLVAKAITDLKGTVRDEGFYLTWSLPKENMDGSRPVDLERFLVLRRDETRGCPECPGEFKVKADLDLRSPQGYVLEDDTVTWKDSGLTEGVIYMYKVIGVNHWGYQSPPSNEVMTRWGGPKE
jgi:predicted small lipoprotein YifL